MEIQFGKYAFVAHDLFVKHLSFYVSDIIDVGVEVLPMKELEKEMSSGVPYLRAGFAERVASRARCSGCAVGAGWRSVLKTSAVSTGRCNTSDPA